MIYPPGQGKSGPHLMRLWREYLEQYADREGDAEGQTIVGSYHAAEVLSVLSRTLDQDGRYRDLIDQRVSHFHEASKLAMAFEDCLMNATFAIYNNLNTLSHQFTEESVQASALIREVDNQVHRSTECGDQINRSAAALRAGFPLLCLITIALDQDRSMTHPIQQVEQRFAAGARAASTDWEHLLNALYRIVEMVQILALLTDHELKDQIYQIATRFKEEDQAKELRLKLRNGFCRLFELGHLLIVHVDAML
jgi:hypothetical protein